jgi:hypothetical protein
MGKYAAPCIDLVQNDGPCQPSRAIGEATRAQAKPASAHHAHLLCRPSNIAQKVREATSRWDAL